MERKPKTLLYDLEVSREVVEGYRNKYDFNVVKVIRHQFMMSYLSIICLCFLENKS